MEHNCVNGHQLWKSWTGTMGCLHDGCLERRTIEPGDEIVADCWGRSLRTCPRGHPQWLGWRRKGCLEEGCEHHMPEPVR